MRILNNVLSLFTRKKPAEAATELPSQAPTVDPAPAPILPSDNVIHIYSHGFTNGIYRIDPDKDSFERFLEYCNHLDRVRDHRLLKEKALVEMELKLNTALIADATDKEHFIEKSRLADNLSLSISELEHQRQKNNEKETALATEIKGTISEYPWIPAFFYLIAAAIFIIADISITKQITAWGFDMHGWQGFLFSLGLAFTAFLIKPTVDRWLEKPFQASGFKLKLVYKIVLFSITIVGLFMLYSLGRFRSDSEIAQKELTTISAQMQNYEPDSPQFKDLQAKYDEIQKSLDNNPNGQTGLILSGMLFSIGGAICLTIAFGSLKQLIHRHCTLPAQLKSVKKATKIQDQRIAELRSEHTTVKAEQEKAERRLSIDEIPILTEALKQIRSEYSTLLNEFYQVQYEKERALYLDGKNKGEKYQIEGELLYKISGNDHSSPYLNKLDEKGKTESLTPMRPYTRRPFIKIRKMIADNFNRNQNTQTYDGTEFEIVD
jgi:hypothetical protein